MRVVLVALAACTADVAVVATPLAPLPPPAPVTTERFRDAEACAQCHLVADDTPVLHDAAGDNVSPVLLWRASLMGLAARDPYYLAVFDEERQHGDVDKLCTRCHSPAASEELATTGAHVTWDQLTAGDDDGARLARGGVTCTLCHQIDAANLGTETSFSGGFTTTFARELYGRYGDPMQTPMQLIVDYTPTLGSHVASAELCGTCHTVIVPTAAGPVVEQATFLEWRASSLAATKPCQVCHVPITDDANAPITAPIASFPAGLAARQPVGRHTFVGGNSYVLSLIGDGIDWAGANIPASELYAAAARDEAHLQTAAKLSIVDAHRESETAVITVRVTNLTGHKLPTGYPGRRMWLHVRAGDFVSGADPAPGQPHRDVIDSPEQAPVWESVLVDATGRPTHRAIDAVGYGKDDRILPAGYAPASSLDRSRTAPVGVDGDASFVAGSDDVTYRIAASAGMPVAIDLEFESIPADLVDASARVQTPAGARFAVLASRRSVEPIVLAHVAQTLP